MPRFAKSTTALMGSVFAVLLSSCAGSLSLAEDAAQRADVRATSNIAAEQDSANATRIILKSLTDKVLTEDELILHEDPTLALMAKWRQYLNSTRSLAQFERFAGYAEGRLRVSMSHEFKASLFLRSKRWDGKLVNYSTDQYHEYLEYGEYDEYGESAPVDSGGFTLKRKYEGLRSLKSCNVLVSGHKSPYVVFLADQHVTLVNAGERLRLGVNDEFVELGPDALAPMLNAVHGFPCLTAAISEDQVAIAIFESMGWSFPIYLFERSTGKCTWQGVVWAGGRSPAGPFAGPFTHIVHVGMDRSRVIVFGLGFGHYCEVLQLSDGTGIGRFSSAAWGNRNVFGANGNDLQLPIHPLEHIRRQMNSTQPREH